MNGTLLKLGSLLGLACAIIGLSYMILNNGILSTNPIGIIVQVCAAALMIWARITFGSRSFHATANTTAGGLVTNGPYRFLRHPIYAAIIYFAWAAALSDRRIYILGAATFISVGLIARMLIEEKFLNSEYSDYKSYSEKTVRLIPFLF